MNKMRINIGAVNLTVEKYESEATIPELSVYLEDNETGLILQDIALIRQSIKDISANETYDNTVDCLVWADKDDEDYTHKFVISLTEEEWAE